MHQQTKRRPFFAAALSLLLAFTLFFTGTAYAKSASFVSGWEDTGETTAYLSTISPDNLEYTIHNPKVKAVYSRNLGGTVFYYDSLVPGGQQANLGKALTFSFENAGITVDGRSLDAVFDFTVSLLGREAHDEGRPCFLKFFGNENVLWDYGAEDYVPGQDKLGSGSYGVVSADIKTDARLVYSDTGEPFEGGLQICVADLDMVDRTDRTYSESMRLDYGFGDRVYVSEDTKLDRSELAASGYTHFVATRSDSNTFLSGFAASTDDSSFGFTWRGTDCGTQFAVRYPNFPASAVGQPIKAAAPELAEWEGNASFRVTQKLPYVVPGNKADSIVLTDTLDKALDASKATVRVSAAGKDATANWDVSVRGQQITCTARDTALAQGEHIFTVFAPIRTDVDFSGYEVQGGYCLIPNQASLTVNDVQQTTNTATVGVTYGTVEVFKSSANPSVTDDNACYTLEGAEYTVYRDKACTDPVDTFTTGPDGHGISSRLPVSSYYVKETKAPEGYCLDDAMYTVRLAPLDTFTLDVEETPVSDPAPVLVQKKDAQIASAGKVFA